jgi:hypothetical protein
MAVKRVIVLILTLSSSWVIQASGFEAVNQQAPAELRALLSNAKIDGTVASWCSGEFRAGERDSFAVALATPAGGRYMALEGNGRSTQLATFKGRADLSCYSRADAAKLDQSIRQSDTIHGQVTPRWNTTVVCGFIDETTAECWQYSPNARTFVKIGGWTT